MRCKCRSACCSFRSEAQGCKSHWQGWTGLLVAITSTQPRVLHVPLREPAETFESQWQRYTMRWWYKEGTRQVQVRSSANQRAQMPAEQHRIANLTWLLGPSCKHLSTQKKNKRVSKARLLIAQRLLKQLKVRPLYTGRVEMRRQLSSPAKGHCNKMGSRYEVEPCSSMERLMAVRYVALLITPFALQVIAHSHPPHLASLIKQRSTT